MTRISAGSSARQFSVTAADVEPPPPAPTALVVGGAYGSNADPTPVEDRAEAVFGSSRTYYGPTGQAGAIARIKANEAAGRRVSHISFKLPHAWAAMATGAGDAWAKDLSSRIQAAIAGTDHVVRIAMHHEPENDTGENPGDTAAGRDAWKAMQARLAPLFDKPGIEYVIVLMGYHSFSTASPLYPLWRLDACIPNTPALKGIGYDIYESYGASGSTTWKDWDGYFGKIEAFHAPRGLAWGLSETGLNDAAFAANPRWFAEVIDAMVDHGGSWFDYFNTNLNSTATWAMTAGSAREKGFIEALVAADR